VQYVVDTTLVDGYADFLVNTVTVSAPVGTFDPDLASNSDSLSLDYVTVFIASDPVQAHLVRGLIEAEGITVYLKGEALTSALGELPVTVKQVEVQVPREDRVRALELAARFEKPTA
jgi:hypothetical protein